MVVILVTVPAVQGILMLCAYLIIVDIVMLCGTLVERESHVQVNKKSINCNTYNVDKENIIIILHAKKYISIVVLNIIESIIVYGYVLINMSCYYPLSFIAADSSLCKKAQPGAEPFCGSVECSCPTEHYTCPQDSVFIETRTTPCCVTYSCQCPNISCPYLMECGHGVQPIPNYYGGRYPGRCCTEYSFEGILCYLIFLFYLIIFVFKNLYIFFFLNVLFLFVDVDECHDSNVKTCSDICINERPFFSCACPSGKTLANDGRTCGGSNSY